jgi:hypothetical protein
MARRHTGKWMALIHQLAQSFVEDMGVNLCGRNIGVAEHFLHAAQVGLIVQ